MALFDKVLMCPPDHFKVAYKINPWMGGCVDPDVARQQWNHLKAELERCSVQVLTIEPQPDLPDMVFSCNSGIVYGNSVYLAHFRHKERQGERQHYEKWFKEHGLNVLGDKDYFFEGGGDAVFSSRDTLWAGYGFRSQKEAYKNIEKMGNFQVIYCQLVNEHYYHMDVCFCPLSKDLALWYPDAFSPETQERMRKRIALIEVSKEEVDRFACNAMAADKTVLLPAHCPQTKQQILKHGFQVAEIELGEFLKSGGAVQCLILKL